MKILPHFAVIGALLWLTACNHQDQINDQSPQQHKVINPIENSILWMSGDSKTTTLWKKTIEDHCTSSVKMEPLAFFNNKMDTSMVYALIRVNSNYVENARSWCDSVGYECEFYKESIPIDQKIGSGDDYLFISHNVEDLSAWNSAFMSMYTYKESDSIYTLGVLNGLTDSLNVAVLSRTSDLTKAAEYGSMLQEKGILRNAGVIKINNSAILRRI